VPFLVRVSRLPAVAEARTPRLDRLAGASHGGSARSRSKKPLGPGGLAISGATRKIAAAAVRSL
jgi:hypothetical protein